MTHDLIVIGAGPAGMAAATQAAALGLRTLLLDRQPRPGGQVYRDVGAADPRVAALLGPDYTHGLGLVRALADSGAEHRPGALVWDIASDLTVTTLEQGRCLQWRAPQLVVATGAIERPSPMPGWTLPGVMNAGAAQIALKSAGIVPAGRVVLAGDGPLLLLVACQLLDAGAEVAAVVHTSPWTNRLAAAGCLTDALAAPRALAKGLAMLQRLRRAGVPRWHRATALAVEGSERAEALTFDASGRRQRIAAGTVLLHHGVIPNTQITRLLRVRHRWSAQQLAWQVEVDEWGRTSHPGLAVAGDGAAIAGARAAEAAGMVAAIGAARALGRLGDEPAQSLAAAPRQRLAAERRIRPFLDALYRPADAITRPGRDTVVCRCEEVTAGRIREMAALGCRGPNQTKFFSRCGMGPCQGRVCGNVVTQLLADELGISPQEVGAYRIRAPLEPVPLAALASLAVRAQSAAGTDGASQAR